MTQVLGFVEYPDNIFRIIVRRDAVDGQVSASMHSWTNINSPPDSSRYLFLLFFMVNPMGFIFPLHADRRSPAAKRSR